MAQVLFSAFLESLLYGVGWLVTKPADAISVRLVGPGHPALRMTVDLIFCVLLFALGLTVVAMVVLALFWLGQRA